jgi:hypothetical protein
MAAFVFLIVVATLLFWLFSPQSHRHRRHSRARKGCRCHRGWCICQRR